MRKVIALIGALALILSVAGPVAARSGTPPPDTGGWVFTIPPNPQPNPCHMGPWGFIVCR